MASTDRHPETIARVSWVLTALSAPIVIDIACLVVTMHLFGVYQDLIAKHTNDCGRWIPVSGGITWSVRGVIAAAILSLAGGIAIPAYFRIHKSYLPYYMSLISLISVIMSLLALGSAFLAANDVTSFRVSCFG